MRILNDKEIELEFTEYTDESKALWASTLGRDEKIERAFKLLTVPQRIAKAQHQQDLKDFIYLIEAGTPDGKWLSDILDELKQLLRNK